MRGKILNALIVVGSFVVGASFTYFVIVNPFWENKGITTDSGNSNNAGVVKYDKDITIDETGISSAVGKIYDAAVTVENIQRGQVSSTGSGFVYKTDDNYGYILTNQHVVEESSSITIVMSDKTEVEGKLLGSDEYLDLAVVRIDKKNVKLVATLGTSEDSELGDTVFTIGSPVGVEYSGTVTRGTLSGKNRMVSVSISNSENWIMKVLQIDAAINPGNSGGPLLNVNGEVIGINSLKLAETSIEGMGFAIPIEYAMNYAEVLETGKEIERPFIGISMVDVDNTNMLYQAGLMIDKDITYGAVILSISLDSGASEAGLEKGDIIIKLGDKKIEDTSYLKYELYQYKVGDTVKVTYIRNGEQKTTNITLGKVE